VQKVKLILIVLIVFSNSILSQRYTALAPHISLFGGDLSVLPDNFTNYYDSKNGFTFGIGIGVPISRSLTLDASVSYFEKQSNFNSQNQLNVVDNAILKQLIVNSGIQYHLLPHRIVGLTFLAGFNYSFVDEERKNSDGEFVYEVEGGGNLGVYGGVNFELSLGRGPIAVFGEGKYTYALNPILIYGDNYRELKYIAGLKLYFANRWK